MKWRSECESAQLRPHPPSGKRSRARPSGCTSPRFPLDRQIVSLEDKADLVIMLAKVKVDVFFSEPSRAQDSANKWAAGLCEALAATRRWTPCRSTRFRRTALSAVVRSASTTRGEPGVLTHPRVQRADSDPVVHKFVAGSLFS